MEDTNSASDWSNGAHEAPLEAPLVVDTGDAETLVSTDGAPRTPTHANRISISELIRTLTQPTVGLFPQGVAPKELFDFMCKLPEDQRVSKSRNHLQVLLWRDVKLGKICRVGVGVYTVPEFLEQISQHKGQQQQLNNCAPMKSQVSPENSSSSTSSSSSSSMAVVVSTTSAPLSVNEQDSNTWRIINETVIQSAQFAKNNKRKKRKDTTKIVESRENTPQISPAGDSNEKPENNVVSSTTTTVDETPETKPKRKRVKKQQIKDDPDSVCFFCQMTGSQNIFGQPESFICCKDCLFKAHPSCLGYSVELAERCRNYPWQCFDCKLCSLCLTSENPESMLMCDNCDRGYHMQCHTPVVEEKPPQSDKWICSECLSETKKKNQTGGLKAYCKKTKNASSLTRQVQIKNTVELIGCTEELDVETAKLNAQLDKFTLPTIDDNPLIKKAATEAKLWSVDQVFSFISQLGFPEQASAFKREEIDGQALLLLKRNDVLSMLSLKLGPALKIHRRLATLQTLIGEVNEELEDQ